MSFDLAMHGFESYCPKILSRRRLIGKFFAFQAKAVGSSPAIGRGEWQSGRLRGTVNPLYKRVGSNPTFSKGGVSLIGRAFCLHQKLYWFDSDTPLILFCTGV